MIFDGDLEHVPRRRKQKFCDTDVRAKSRDRFKRAFRLFQKLRGKQPEQSLKAKSAKNHNTCSCGQPKYQNNKYCYSCADARAIIRQRYGTSVKFIGVRQQPPTIEIYRTPHLQLQRKSIAATDFEESRLDTLIKLCEMSND